MRIHSDRTAVVLVDLQADVLGMVDRVVPDGSVTAALLEHVQGLVEFARARDIPVIWVKVERRPDLLDQADVPNGQVRSGMAKPPREAYALIEGTDGAAFAEPLKPADDEDIVVKRRVSGFHGTALDTLLRARGVTSLLLGGVNTEMGVESTARSAWDHDYHSVVIADCCASTNAMSHEHALAHTLPRFAEIARLHEIVGASA